MKAGNLSGYTACILICVFLAPRLGLCIGEDEHSATPRPQVTLLRRSLFDCDPLVCKHAALAIAEAGNEAASAKEDLQKLLCHADPSVRSASAKALEAISNSEKAKEVATTKVANDEIEGQWVCVSEQSPDVNANRSGPFGRWSFSQGKALMIVDTFNVYEGNYSFVNSKKGAAFRLNGTDKDDKPVAINWYYRRSGDCLIVWTLGENERDSDAKTSGATFLLFRDRTAAVDTIRTGK
jgi:hypothetical protein